MFNHTDYKFLRHRATCSNEKHSNRQIENQVQTWKISLKTCYQRQPKNNNPDSNKILKSKRKALG